MARKKEKSKLQLSKFLPAIKRSWQTRRATYIVGVVVIIIVLVLGGLFIFKKNWFVVAMVNNRPITSVELYQRLNQRYGKDVLEGLIEEKLIYGEAAKQKVTVSSKEIDDRLAEVEKQLGGKEALDAALAAQGVSLQQVKGQIRIQLIVEKILGKDIQVSSTDIANFIKDNPTAKGLSQDQIKQQVRSQKVNEKAASWLNDLKKKAKIVKFI